MKGYRIIGLLCGVLLLVACGKKATTETQKETVRPEFSSDSAYAYIEKQMSFGPRVPNSEAHMYCRLWLTYALQQMGAEVEIQRGTMKDFRGHDQQVYNIIGHFSTPEIADRSRLLLCAHYDTRPWCDEEPLNADRYYNVPGANDGASGVGVLMEVARQLSIKQADSTLYIPVDIIFFDVEDMGTPSFYTGSEREHTWCLGSQLWAYRYAEDPTVKYRYGILLDMVGAPDAVFPMEYYSSYFAASYQQQIWRSANKLGYATRFHSQRAGAVIDDHYYINEIAKIPCLDIIHYDMNSAKGFAFWWHTRQDDMNHISKQTLQAVGEVVLSQL